MKIAHLTSVHQPFDIRIFHKECKTLAGAGYDVALVVPAEHSSHTDGVTIHAVPVPGNRLVRMLVTVWAVLRVAMSCRAQIYHFHDPELIPVGFFLKLIGKRVVYDVHEDLPRQVLSKSWIPAWLRVWVSLKVRLIEWAAGRIFDSIVTVTPHISRRFPSKKTVIVRNYPVIKEFAEFDSPPMEKRPSWIAYVGAIAEIRGIREMVGAMEKLPGSQNPKLIMGGLFESEALLRDIESYSGWERVDYRGWQNRDQVAEIFSRVRAGLVILHPTPNYLEALPVKLFEYMAAGLPVIASDFPGYREIVSGSDCGLVVNPKSSDAIAEAILWLLEHPAEAEAMGKRGRNAVLRKYNWDSEERTLLDMYRRVLGTQ